MGSNSIAGSLASQAQTSLMQAQEDHLVRQVTAAQAGKEDGRIEKSSREFEAMLLSNWLQQAEQSMASVPGAEDDDDSSSGRDQMMSLGVQSLATSLASSGGIGIAAMIAKALHSAADTAQPTAGSSAPQGASKIEKQG
jgi:Rod binding domain-containing protein